MKKELKGFVTGVISTSLLLGGTVFADGVKQTIEVVFNGVNLKVNGQTVQADNILYDGTTYVPLRRVAEMFSKEVSWEGSTNTASINDKGFLNKGSQKSYKIMNGYKAVVKINGDIFDVSTPQWIRIDNENNPYSLFGSEPVSLLCIAFKDYSVSQSMNPFIKGVLVSDSNVASNYMTFEHKVSGANEQYTLMKYFNKDRSKSYDISTKLNETKGIVMDKQDQSSLIPLKDLFSTLGIKLSTELDDTNKLVIFSFE
ncbi:stalk domain-containing protein [Paenibacillus aurantius]|uniref:Stalk domain-containing protein n=1 Tax=Paenibacillus aurantius TaxID=2918900 RepID=A0AA96LHF5_9BACL|nr:stalk domain-containing protein [Paenibacillus aurantius]WNQ12061.1 stalk domain-containing protein [Paenibacillus aurantius]